MAVKLSALRAGRPLPPRKIPVSRRQGHSAAGKIRVIEKSDDLIGNRTPDLPACSVVPQPATLPPNDVCDKLACITLHVCLLMCTVTHTVGIFGRLSCGRGPHFGNYCITDYTASHPA
jgi:hypothetical protein